MSCLGGSSTLRFSSLAALTRFVFLVVRPSFLFERFRRHNRHSKGSVSYIRSRVHVHWTIYRTENNYRKDSQKHTRNTIFTYEWKAQFRKWREREIKKYLNLSRCNKWTPSRGKTNSSVYRRLLKVSRMMCQFDKCWTYLCFSISLRQYSLVLRRAKRLRYHYFENPAYFDNRIYRSIILGVWRRETFLRGVWSRSNISITC